MKRVKIVIAYGILAMTWVTKRSWWQSCDKWAQKMTGKGDNNTQNDNSS